MSSTRATTSNDAADARASPEELAASITLLQPLVVHLARCGHDSAALLYDYGLTAADLQDANRRVPERVLRHIWHAAIMLTGDPALGVHAAQSVEPKALGVLGYVLANAKTVGQALLLWSRFNRLLFDQPLWQLERRNDSCDAFVGQRGTGFDIETSRPAVEFATCSLHRMATFLAMGDSRTQQFVRVVEFRHQRPDKLVLDAYTGIFGDVPIRFRAKLNSIVFDRELLAVPIAFADPAMLTLMQQQADQQLRAMATETDIVDRVRAVIRRRLVGQAPLLSTVAADCNVSRSTLQRKLAAADTSFQILLDEQRFEQARELLSENAQPIEQIGFLLGYSEPAAFQHAFRRWANCSPGAFRAAAANHTD